MRGVSFMRCIGRLKPGVSIEQAQAAMPALAQSYREQHPETADNSWAPVLMTAAEDVTGNLRSAFLTLLAAVLSVLLIACSNVANLLLVRFTGRRREIALRMALGAERRGIVRLFVLESALVSVIAGAVGLCLALWTVSFVPPTACNLRRSWWALPVDGKARNKRVRLANPGRSCRIPSRSLTWKCICPTATRFTKCSARTRLT